MKIVGIDEVNASAYNPRTSDPKRLDYIELSLRKLGFLLPLYADQNGELLSGHQRQLVSRRIGITSVPVEYVPHKSLEERKKWNIAFNRATNDLKRSDTSASVTEKISKIDVFQIASHIPDVDINSDELFPCLHQKPIDVEKLVKLNINNFDDYTYRVSNSLLKIGVEIPIVISESFIVINGIGRLRSAVERGRKTINAVIVPDSKAEFARIMLNFISMDFDIHTRYADELRYNSFMRPRNTRSKNYALGNGFYKGVFPNNKGEDFPVLKGDNLEKWKAAYGESIVDFGAGKLLNTIILRNSGIDVTPFEPYFIGVSDDIHKPTSLKIARDFLESVRSGKKFDSIFISSVFNSVPFMQDRKYIAVICSAICSSHTKLVCWTQSDTVAQSTKITSVRSNRCDANTTTFMLNYEPNVALGDISSHPKVQKFHTRQEMVEIFSPVFGRISRLDKICNFWYLEAVRAKPVDPAVLKAALEFEFELPYPDGTKMGLSEEAKSAFEERLGIKFQ